MYHAYHPENIGEENANQMQATYTQKQQEWLAKLNAAPNIIYYQDLATLFPKVSPEELGQQRQKQLEAFEIEAQGSVNPSYTYRGNNPSQALDNLLRLTPCYLECGSALVLASYLALRDTLGPSAFNTLIKTMHDGVLKIKNAHFPPFYRRTYYARTFEEIQKMRAPLNFNADDFLPGAFAHIVGSPFGFSIHPGSELNGYNVLWIAPNAFLGFSSIDDKPESQESYFQLLGNAFHQHLTYQDLSFIDQLNKAKPHDYAFYSPSTHRQTYDLLTNENAAQMTHSLQELESGKVKEYDRSPIPVPRNMQHMPIVGAHAFTAIDPKQFLLYISLNKESLKAEKEKSKPKYIVKNNPLPLYDQQNIQAPFKTYAEITYFQQQTPERIRNKQAGGLMIQGKLGVDVEDGCEDALEVLSAQHNVLKVSDLDGDLHARMLTLIERNHGKLDVMVNTMSRTWQAYDVFYINDVNNNPSSAKTLLARALFIYCKRNQKQLLIIGEADFFKLFPVYDQQLSWMRTLKIEPKPTPLSPSKKK